MKTPRAKHFVDGSSTSHDWQRHIGGVAILPVGSFEQHGGHLPVATDNIQVEFFAQFLAREIGAALLPVIPIFQCYEHTGFRGSFSLTPETAMAIVRDIAADLAGQNFSRLILLNGHGGNFALPTVVRDINRLDGPLKIMLVNYTDCCDSSCCNFADDLHSGAWETSMFMAIDSELRRDSADTSPARKIDPEATGQPEITIPQALRGDLNHFGLGTLRPRGPWGDQLKSDIEYGRRIVESIKTNLVPHVNQRLKWFDRHPKYGGPGNILLREMTASDIDRAMEMVKLAGWNQTEEDWRMFLRCAPDGCFVAVHNGLVVATATAVSYNNKVGWIGMILVDPSMRRRGIATMLMKHAIEILSDCKSVKLDATPAGHRVYPKLGFEDEYELARMICDSPAAIAAPVADSTRPMTEADLEAVIAMDAEVFGVRRDELLKASFQRAPEMCLLSVAGGDKGKLTGFAMGRVGSQRPYIGPIAADSDDIAFDLVRAIAASCEAPNICIDINDRHPEFRKRLEAIGFAYQRPFIRMYCGNNSHPGQPQNQYAIAGPAWG